MPLSHLPAVFMRGGTSNALVFRQDDLPIDRADWDPIFLAAMGSPDPNGRQLDGMGGGISSLSKVCILGPASRADADVDYTFAQIPINGTAVDYSGNCGNMSSAMGPAAVEFGMVSAPDSGEAVVRIHNTNTGKVITARFAMKEGLPLTEGDFAIDGVAGTAAPVRLEFDNPAGTKTGKLLPTGHAVDWLEVGDFGPIEATMVDAANPCVFVKAQDLGKSGQEAPSDLEGDSLFLARMEAIRCVASVAMGIAPDQEAAARIPSVPKVAIIAPPADYTSLSGRALAAADLSLLVRMISIGQPHRAVPITGAICLGIAARIPGSLAHRFCTTKDGPITVAHPSGTTVVDALITLHEDPAQIIARAGVVYRTARKLFSGAVWYRLDGGEK